MPTEFRFLTGNVFILFFSDSEEKDVGAERDV
jgi:hypothetical protein